MWALDERAPVPLWRAASPSNFATPAFSTRRGGVSAPPFDTLNLGRSTEDRPEAVTENRRRFLQALALSPADLVTAGQIHGAAVGESDGPGHVPACDILVTRRPRLALAVTTADCMPLLFLAPGAVAAAHAGWRGADLGAPLAALRAVCERSGADPASVEVHLGPCIRACCYEVGEEVARRFPGEVVRRVNGSLRLDLPAVARLQLLGAGVRGDAWHDLGACTACHPDLYFSHRRDRGRTGRHWGVVALAG